MLDIPAPNTDFVAIAAGDYYSLGLKSDGSIAGWGFNSNGQLNVPAPNADFVAIAAGGYGFVAHSLGLKSDGTIVGWGSNNSGQLNVPAPNANFVAIAAGASGFEGHSLGLKSDGTIVAWGSNGFGELNVPAPNADFVAIAAGWSHSVGLKYDGTIVEWGSGQVTVPAPNANFVAIAAGFGNNLAIRSQGSPVPTALQYFDASWKDNRVVVAWRLIDSEGMLTFEVYRRHDPGSYVRLDGVTVASEGSGAFHFEDRATDAGWKYQYQVIVLEDGEAVTSFETSVTTPLLQVALGQNHPNPFNPTTEIPFSVAKTGRVSLNVYDAGGRLVRRLVDGVNEPGSHTATWDGRDDLGNAVGSGVYFCRLTAGKAIRVRKMVLLK